MHGVDFYLMHLFIDIIIEWVLSHYYYYDSGIVETALGNLNEGTQDYYFLWGGGGGGGGSHITSHCRRKCRRRKCPLPHRA